MTIVKIPTESIQLKDKVVHTGTEAQCHRFIYYMEGASDEMILSRLDLSK